MKKIWPLVLGLLVCAALPAFGETKKPEPIKVEVAVSVSLVSASSEPDPTKAPCTPDYDVRTSELCAAWKSADAAAGIDWETLLVGGLSVLAASVASLLLWVQINQTKNQERDRLKRKYFAARATLPLALTQIIDFCVKSSGELKAFYDLGGIAQQVHLRGFEAFEIPESVMVNIATMIENTPHDNVAERLSEIVAMTQILQSRMQAGGLALVLYLAGVDLHGICAAIEAAIIQFFQ